MACSAGWGAGLGVIDVGMNTGAAAVQNRLGRSVMSGFAVLGAGLAVAVLARFVLPPSSPRRPAAT
jgi:hypothetical protein